MIVQKGPAMKQALLVLTVFLTVCTAAVAAQQNDPGLLNQQALVARCQWKTFLAQEGSVKV